MYVFTPTPSRLKRGVLVYTNGLNNAGKDSIVGWRNGRPNNHRDGNRYH